MTTSRKSFNNWNEFAIHFREENNPKSEQEDKKIKRYNTKYEDSENLNLAEPKLKSKKTRSPPPSKSPSLQQVSFATPPVSFTTPPKETPAEPPSCPNAPQKAKTRAQRRQVDSDPPLQQLFVEPKKKKERRSDYYVKQDTIKQNRGVFSKMMLTE